MLLDELKSILIKNNLWAKKKFGQNFLIDEQVFCSIIEAADLKKEDTVIEVGPGTGFLTERLLEKAAKVIAVEKDSDMVKVLEDKFKDNGKLKIINDDILKVSLVKLKEWIPTSRDDKLGVQNDKNAYKVVANIPYYITSPLLKHFLQAEKKPELMVLLVQKEVAEKITGKSGKSLITIETQVYGIPEIIRYVPANSFYPAPKVESAILRINTYDKPLVNGSDLKDFLKIVKFGFSQKRKKLKSSIGAGLHLEPSEIKKYLSDADIDPDCRAENLDIDDWKRLTKKLKDVK